LLPLKAAVRTVVVSTMSAASMRATTRFTEAVADVATFIVAPGGVP
jgi:hypothetical protein